jgi:hypothetical protein
LILIAYHYILLIIQIVSNNPLKYKNYLIKIEIENQEYGFCNIVEIKMMTVEPSNFLSSTPFLYLGTVPQSGKITGPNEPLSRIQVPLIQTLVSKTINENENLGAVNVNEILLRTGITPRQPVRIKDETIGIELSLNLGGNSSRFSSAQISPAELQTGQTMGKFVPTNLREARDALHMITSQRKGTTNRAFAIGELKTIARNLDLPSTGSKDILANRIRSHVIEFFHLQIA